MKRLIRSCYDKVSLTPGKRQEILTDVIQAKNEGNGLKRPVWKAAAVAAAIAVIALAIALPLALLNKDSKSFEGSIAMSQSTPPEITKAIAAAEESASYSTAIMVSLNPDVEIRLDTDGIVTEVVGLNEDGIALIEGIDFAGMSLENATIMVVNQLILKEYITAAEIQEEINISLKSDTMTLDTLSVMTNIIKAAATAQNISVDVIQNADDNRLQIVLEGQGEPEVWPELPPTETPLEEDAALEEPTETPMPAVEAEIGLEVEFRMAQGGHTTFVDNMLVHKPEGGTASILLDAASMRLNRVALLGLVELLDKGYITDADNKAVRLFFAGDCSDEDIESVAELTALLIAEYDMKIAVTADVDQKQILLIPDETVTYEAQPSKLALRDVLNHMVNKDEEDLSPRQISILKMAFTFKEYQRLLEKRYFVIVPNLVGMTEEKAVEMLQQLGFYPGVVREKRPGYDPNKENGGLKYPKDDEELTPEYWAFPVVDFGCVFYQDSIPGHPSETGMGMQINVIVLMDDERPEVSDYRMDSGIVIREMDVSFDVSAYPDKFLLSEAEGLNALIRDMNERPTAENAADYTVTIDRNTGWPNTAVITIAHRDGFPLSKFFVQEGRIIEHEFLWRRDAQPAEESFE
jgi:hypothetical protein